MAGYRNSRHARKGEACTDCHAVHKAGVGQANLKQAQIELCASCHPEKKAEINNPYHHPVKEGKVLCSDCHNPHKNTAAAKKSYSKACVSCHPEKAGPFKYEHNPVADNCLNCHSPHGSMSQDMLTISKPALCLQCHGGTLRVLPSHNVLNNVTNNCTTCHKQVHGSNTSASLQF